MNGRMTITDGPNGPKEQREVNVYFNVNTHFKIKIKGALPYSFSPQSQSRRIVRVFNRKGELRWWPLMKTVLW